MAKGFGKVCYWCCWLQLLLSQVRLHSRKSNPRAKKKESGFHRRKPQKQHDKCLTLIIQKEWDEIGNSLEFDFVVLPLVVRQQKAVKSA